MLREPWRQALRPLVFWVIAAALYAALSALFGADTETVLRVVDATLIGGVMTCAIGYLMIERSFRPLFAHVLDGLPKRRPRTPGVRLRLMLAWAPGELVDTLNDFFDVVVPTMDAQGGWVNKFEGDSALCIFGVPGTQPDHADRALRAARRLALRLLGLAERHPGLEAGIGVSSGRVVAGYVGTEARYEYTVIGPAVNEAARLTDIAKGRAVKVLVSAESVRRAAAEAAHWRDVGTVALRGRTAPTAIYEPLPEQTEPSRGEAIGSTGTSRRS